jgi:hypothetical protein
MTPRKPAFPALRGLVSRLAMLALLAALPAQARWTHFAPVQAPLDQPLRLEFLDPEGMATPGSALLFLDLDGRTLDPVPAAELGAGRVVFQVPAGLLQGRELSYRVEIRHDQEDVRLPASGSWRVTLAPESDLALVNLLSDPTAEEGGEALLAFSALDDRVDLASAQLWIDGSPVSGLEADAWLVTWRGELPAGPHAVELRLKDRQGRDLQPQRLTLSVRGAQSVPVGWEASAWEEFNMDFLDSRANAQWQRYHAGQLRFRAWRGQGEDAWTLKGRLLLSGQDVESDELQPQSRLTLDLTRKGLLLGVGDRQPEYTPLLLTGTRVRGGELGLDLRDFGLRVVGGRSQEARDPVFGAAAGDLRFVGAFARDLYAMDLRLGRRGGLVEGGFSVLKVKDDVESISARPPAAWGADSLARVSPEDNLALGARLDVNAFRGRFTGRNQAAFSLHNSDISGGAWTKEDIEELGGNWEDLPDPSSFENIITINEYFSPMDLADGDVLNSLALLSNWQLSTGPNELLLDFRRVGGAYRSLGNRFLTPDRQELRLTDRVRLLRNQLYLDLGLGLTTDNLDGQFDGGVGTTGRGTVSLGLGWYPKGRDLQVRLGLENQTEANESLDLLEDDATAAETLNAESQYIEGTLNQVRLGVSGSLDWLARRHQWSVNLVQQGYGDDVGQVLDDSLDVLRMDRSYASTQLGLGWQVNLGPRLRLDTGLSVYSSDYDDAGMTDYGYWSLRGSLGRNWLGGRLNGALRAQFQDVGSESAGLAQDFTRLDLGGEVDWTWRTGMSLSTRLDWQSWAGDRDDSFLKVLLRLSQDF